MDIPEQKDSFEKQPDNDLEEQSASFQNTYDSLETLLSSKVVKLIAAKNLVAAEAKLSLSAILLSFSISIALIVITVMVWALLNVGIGFTIYYLSLSLSMPIILLLVINIGLGFWLFKQLKSIWQLVGFNATLAQLALKS